MFNLEKSWQKKLEKELKKDYMKNLELFLEEEVKSGKIIYPSKNEIFSAFSAAKFKNVKVVIIGQDPYHGIDQAHGLSFSVKNGVRIPPSLKNIYKELSSDIGVEIPSHGHLQKWAKQGVLLLNTVLTVEELSLIHI